MFYGFYLVNESPIKNLVKGLTIDLKDKCLHHFGPRITSNYFNEVEDTLITFIRNSLMISSIYISK